ncbi:hypothetical protein CH376_14115 [Leptospira adleri]|uniref:Uncharacterized protein n=1 Tax=Leptospira adleri TaxID=2023186 RepID=A0ABX4P0F2_9LEPT|nr:hypothetical protein CH376_14115 [Leptospira adleri]
MDPLDFCKLLAVFNPFLSAKHRFRYDRFGMNLNPFSILRTAHCSDLPSKAFHIWKQIISNQWLSFYDPASKNFPFFELFFKKRSNAHFFL